MNKVVGVCMCMCRLQKKSISRKEISSPSLLIGWPLAMIHMIPRRDNHTLIYLRGRISSVRVLSKVSECSRKVSHLGDISRPALATWQYYTYVCILLLFKLYLRGHIQVIMEILSAKNIASASEFEDSKVTMGLRDQQDGASQVNHMECGSALYAVKQFVDSCTSYLTRPGFRALNAICYSLPTPDGMAVTM